MMRQAWRDGLRSLRMDARIAVTAVSLLALTIGAITAVFAVVRGIVLRPFAFVDQDRVAIVWPRDDRRAMPVMEVAYGEMEDWRARTRTMADLAVFSTVNWPLALAGGAEPIPLKMAAVSSSFFTVVGTAPLVGRPLEPADDVGAVPKAMVISHGLWTRRFGADPAIVGRPVRVQIEAGGSPVSLTLAGVMPPAFDFPRGAEAWLPAAPLVRRSYPDFYGGSENAVRYLGTFQALARLRDGVPVDVAAAELTRVMRSANRDGGPEAPERLVVTPIADHLNGPAGPVLRTLLAGAALMLLIACANVAGLQVSRTARRERAFAIRAALGASGGRLSLQVLAESVLLTVAALAGAAVVAVVMLRTLLWLAPAGVPRLAQVSLLDARVVTFGMLVTFATVALSALWPVRVTRRMDAATVLARSSPRTLDPRGRRIQRGIVVGQIAVALTLLAGTALFFRTVRGLDQAVLGFNPERLLAFDVAAPTEDLHRWREFYEQVLRRVEASPHVVSAGGVLLRPLMGPSGWDYQPFYPGQVGSDPNTWGLNAHVNFEAVTPGYFRTMGVRLVRGRLFDAQDTATSPRVVVVSESAARRIWPGKDAIGQRVNSLAFERTGPGDEVPWQTVVGVVADVRYRGLNDVRLDMYAPAAQSLNRIQHLMVRTDGDTQSAAAAVRAAVREADPKATVSNVVAMEDVVAAESAPWRFLTRVFVAFAALAALLATVGLGAVVALDVTARRRELAIRAALGADQWRLRRLVVSQAGRLIALGASAGLILTLLLGQAVAHVLINVTPHDSISLAVAAGLAVTAGLAATWLPARRAGRTDPIDALKGE